jgi:molybdate transport system substrate-binding protein
VRNGRGPRTSEGWWARAGSVLLAPLVLAACAAAVPSVQPAASGQAASSVLPAASSSISLPSGQVTVFAAASLGGVLEDLAGRWLTSHPGVELITTLGASNVLATQIAEGAKADVFLSADRQLPAELVEAGLARGEPVVFASNRLAIVAAPDSDRVIQALDIAQTGVRLVAVGPGVPITRYADEVVARLATTADDPVAFQESVAANVVSREDNVRAALAKVELGEGDAAIVYATDARASDRVRVIPLPEIVDVTAEYAAVQIGDGTAAEFIVWLGGPEAADILATAGFEPATE